MSIPRSPDVLRIERHGDLVLVVATPALEKMDTLVEQHESELAAASPGQPRTVDVAAAAEKEVVEIISNCVRDQESPLVLFDLSEVDHFNSMFIALLLKCWKLSTTRGGSMALAGVSPNARELLRITSLDMIFPMYPSRREAMEALLSD